MNKRRRKLGEHKKRIRKELLRGNFVWSIRRRYDGRKTPT